MRMRLHGNATGHRADAPGGISRSSRAVALLLIAAGLTSIASAPPAQAVTLIPGSITAGGNHSCGLTGDGAAYCWGGDSAGQLGNGSALAPDQVSPSLVAGEHVFSKISAGNGFTCAIDSSDDKAYCWGAGTDGQLGNGSTGNSAIPVAVTGHLFSSISAGTNHACAIEKTTEIAYCWGVGTYGQLGNGSTGNSVMPVGVAGGHLFSYISAGNGFTCAIEKTTAIAFCWGDDSAGQLGNGIALTDDQASPSAVDVSMLGMTPPTWSVISAGATHACGIASTGAYCWGSDSFGQLGNGDLDADGLADPNQLSPSAVSPATSFASISAGNSFTCALTSSGSASCWGSDADGQLGDGATLAAQVSPSSVSGAFAAISAGSSHACAYTVSRGSAYCWGADGFGQLGNGSGSSAATPSQVVSRIDILRSGLGTGTVTSSPSGISCGSDCRELPFLASPVELTASSPATWVNAGSTCATASPTTTCTYTVLAPTSITVVFAGTLPAERVSTGTAHACALTTAGAPYCWGSDASGQLGDGSTAGPQVSPVAVTPTLTAASIAAGSQHTCAITAAPGTVSCWGSDEFGQLGNGVPLTDVSSPVTVAGSFVQVVAGGSHSCALTSAGAVSCWGSAASGRIGNGATSGTQASPLALNSPPLEPFVELAAGSSHTCGITTLGAAYCWGSDSSGQLGNGDFLSSDQATPSQVAMPAYTAFVEIAAGGSHTCARTAGGAVYCWGSDESGQIGDATVGGTRTSPTLVSAGSVLFTRLAAGGSHTCGLAAGIAYCWGSDGSGQLGNGVEISATAQEPSAVSMPTGKTFTGISAGFLSTCAWTGTAAWCWGSDTNAQLGNGEAITAAQEAPSLVGADLWILKAGTGRGSISSTSTSYAATVTCDGSCPSQRLTTPFNGSVSNAATASASEDFFGTGTSSFRGWAGAVCTPDPATAPCSVPYPANYSGPLTVTAMFRGAVPQERVGAGYGHSCTLDASDRAWCWGDGAYGKLGQNSTSSSDLPVQVAQGARPVGTTFAQLSVGDNHTCAIAYDGTAWCWGNGTNGRLGNGTTTNALVPTAVTMPALTTFVEVTAGYRHTCAVAYDGKAYCWGSRALGRLGYSPPADVLAPTTSVTSGVSFRRLSAGQNHTCGIDSTGTAWCWGSDAEQQLGDAAATVSSAAPVAVSTSGAAPSYARISAGATHTCGIDLTGKAWCWGTNTYGQLGDGTTTIRPTPAAVAVIATPLTRLSAGLATTCAIGASGSWCWGNDTYGRLGNGSGLSSLSPAAVSPAAVFDQIAVGVGHVCALALTPSVSPTCWGGDYFGQLGNGSDPIADQASPFPVGAHLDLLKAGTASTSVSSSPAGISCAEACDFQRYTVPFGTVGSVTLNLTATPVGTAALTGSPCTGSNTCSVPVTSGHVITSSAWATAPGPTLVEAGGTHTCVVTGGTGGCWGGDLSGQLGDDTTFNTERASPVAVLMPAGVTFTDISAGTAHTCGLATSGSAYCWGADGNGRLGNGTLSTSNLGVASLVVGGFSFKQIAAGVSHTCALTTAGAAYCWGSGANGKLGNGSLVDQPSPSAVTMPAGRTFTSIAAGLNHTCALADNRAIYCWGSDLYGQLGNGAPTADQLVPSLVAAPGVAFTAVTAGSYHSCALTASGTATCWGFDQNGRLGLGALGASTAQAVPAPSAMPASTTFVQISAGNAHTCALSFTGSVYCWGFDSTGQLGNGTTADTASPTLVPMPAGTSRFLAVAAGEQHTCALADDTTTLAADVSRWCWGSDANGRLGNGTTIITSPLTAPSRVTAAIDVSTSGSGTVNWVSPLTGSCPGVCTQDVGTDGNVSMTAVPTAGYTFNGWSGPCADPTNLTCVVSTTWSRSVRASFSSVPAFALTLTKTSVSGGVGTVTSSPAGISCGTTCAGASANFASGTSVVLSASAPSGSTFSGWSGACTNLTGTCTLAMSTARSVTATFTSTTAGTFPLSLSKTSVGAGTGSITSSPTGISCGTTCSSASANYASGTVVTLTPTPASGSLFGGWTGACTNATGTCSVLMDQVRSVSAKFYTTRKMTVGKVGSGTVTSSPAGINCGATCTYSFEYGTAVTFTPTPATGWRFDRWTGSCNGTTCSLSASADFTITANFVQITYAVSVTRSSLSSGTGTVVSSPSGISCGTACTASFAGGSTVTLTATPASGSVFSGWSGACTNLTGTCVVVMDQVKSVTATFTGVRTLTVSRTGSGSVTSSPAGINCGSTCSFTFTYGSGVSLTATPATGYRFTGWSGSCSGASCSLTMTSNYSVTANFALIVNYTLTVSKTSVSGGAGTVTSNPTGINCGTTCSASFVSGTAVTLTASAAGGSRFSGWSGACTGTSTTCIVSMTASKSVTATFSK